jgi:hypothetical protein
VAYQQHTTNLLTAILLSGLQAAHCLSTPSRASQWFISSTLPVYSQPFYSVVYWWHTTKLNPVFQSVAYQRNSTGVHPALPVSGLPAVHCFSTPSHASQWLTSGTVPVYTQPFQSMAYQRHSFCLHPAIPLSGLLATHCLSASSCASQQPISGTLPVYSRPFYSVVY